MAKKEIAAQDNKALDIVGREKLLEWLDTFGVGANLNDKEKEQFCQTAQAFNLNPIKREIHCIAYTDKKGKRTLSLVTGYEVYIRRAERSGKLNGWSVTHAGSTKTPDDPLRAAVTIHRKDWDHPLTHEVYLFEYKKDNAFWNGKPLTMLKKTCIAQAFRLCFPEELGGMPYTTDEMSEEMEFAGESTVKPEDTTEPGKEESGGNPLSTVPTNTESGDGPENFDDDIPWGDEEGKEGKTTNGITPEKRVEITTAIDAVTEYLVNNKEWLPNYSQLIDYVDKLEITAEQNFVKTKEDPIQFIEKQMQSVKLTVEGNKSSQEQDLDIF